MLNNKNFKSCFLIQQVHNTFRKALNDLYYDYNFSLINFTYYIRLQHITYNILFKIIWIKSNFSKTYRKACEVYTLNSGRANNEDSFDQNNTSIRE